MRRLIRVRFESDGKETDEIFVVTDRELKTLEHIKTRGGYFHPIQHKEAVHLPGMRVFANGMPAGRMTNTRYVSRRRWKEVNGMIIEVITSDHDEIELWLRPPDILTGSLIGLAEWVDKKVNDVRIVSKVVRGG